MQRLNSGTAIVAACLVLLSLAGCGGEPKVPKGTISGKLMLNGKPAPAGTKVQFLSASGDAVGADITADGSFTIMGAPVGSYRMMVTPGASGAGTGNMSPEEAMKAVAGTTPGGKGANPNAFAQEEMIPEKFLDASKSGVSLEVKEGMNDFLLDMK